MAKRQMSEADLEGAGLVSRSQRGRGVYDRFRARVIFPIRDHNGGATGFTGRVLGLRPARGPKYLNTPGDGAVRQEPHAVPHRPGQDRHQDATAGSCSWRATRTPSWPTSRASRTWSCSMGTALTAGQVELLTRYAPRIALAYDVDAAGQGAATFGATELTALVGEIERSEHRAA